MVLGAVVSAAGGIVGSYLNSQASKRQVQAQYDIYDHSSIQAAHQFAQGQRNWQREYDLSRQTLDRNHELAEYNKRLATTRSDPYWNMMRTFKAADESGIHRLAALGVAGGGGYSPVPSVGGGGGGGGSGPIPAGGVPGGPSNIAPGDAIASGLAQAGAILSQESQLKTEHQFRKTEAAKAREHNARARLAEAQSRSIIQQQRAEATSGSPAERRGTKELGGDPISILGTTGETSETTTNPEVGQRKAGEIMEFILSGVHSSKVIYDVTNKYLENNLGYSPEGARKVIKRYTGIDAADVWSGKLQMNAVRSGMLKVLGAAKAVAESGPNTNPKPHKSKRY